MVFFLPAQVHKFADRIGFEFEAFPSLAVERTDRQAEFAGRHMRYEKFYAEPGFVVTNYSYLNCPWEELDGLVDEVMNGYDVPEDLSLASIAAE